MTKNKNKKGLTVKDLITAGVFSALLLVANALGGGFFAINPALTFYYPIAGAVLGGPIFMLLLAKVPKRGTLTAVGVVFCILGFVTGMHWGMNLGGLIGLAIADIFAGIKGYKNKWFNILAYMCYCIGPAGTYFVYFANPESWIKTMLKNGTTQDYIDTMNATAKPQILIIMILGTFAVAAVSGFIGNLLMKKQFEKAGVTA